MEKNFYYQNSTIHYQVIGEGRPVVLLHGFGEDSNIWKSQVDFLKSYCKLVIPDLPGSGKSTLLEKEDATIDNYAECSRQLLLHEQIPQATVLGHSMGGYITLALAEKFPGILTAFGLIHSTAFADTEEKKNTRRKGIELINQYGSYAFLKNAIPNLFSDNFKKQRKAAVDALIEAGASFTAAALIQYYVAMINRPDRTNTLKNTRTPVLFVIGKEDNAIPVADLRKQIILPYRSQIHILDQVGHMSMLEATEKLNQSMLDFINS
jgi:pimeloyl-ACP methyl ester carboxylesterase